MMEYLHFDNPNDNAKLHIIFVEKKGVKGDPGKVMV